MNQELLFINILLNKESYNIYSNNINYDFLKEKHRELYYLYIVLRDLHESYPNDLTLHDLQTAFLIRYPEADSNLYNALFDQLQKAPITPEVGQLLLRQINAKQKALSLSEKAFKVAQGLDTEDDLRKTYEAFYNDKDDHQSNVFDIPQVSDDLESIIADVYKETGLRWRLECLNKSLGSLRPGDFGFIFARPETGKTTFLASEIAFMLQGGLGKESKPIVWFNNEEQGSKVMIRIYQAFFGVTMAQLMSNLRRYRDEFKAIVGDKFYLFDAAVINYHQVEAIIKKINPGLVVYDQLTKIRGFKADRNDLLLGQIFQWARELAKGAHAGIGVSQADGSAEGVRYLTMEHVANAKTAVQAEADWILGIGKDHSMEYARFLNISKNKLLGDEDSLPELRHGKFEVLIEPTIARYQDVIKF